MLTVLLACCALTSRAQAAPDAAPPAADGTTHTAAAAPASAIEAQALALQRATQAMLGLRVLAIEDARSLTTLGRQRQGSGVLIGRDGLVLTIGYLLVEAEQVELSTHDGRRLPARVVAQDLATGFGLVQALAPLGLEPAPMGDIRRLAPREPLLTASGGPEAEIGMATLASRRAFSAYWEYHLDQALYTTPPRQDHAGAGLFNLRGELLGVGSLLVPDASEPGTARQPGNLFVPIELLAPVLPELLSQGRSQASLRAWLGLNCAEVDGEVRVLRVAQDSPADVAGLMPGDRVLAIDGTPVADLAVLWKTLWARQPPARSVQLDLQRGRERLSLSVYAIDRDWTMRRAEGI